MLNLDYKRSWPDLFKQEGDYNNNISWLNNSNYSFNQINFGGQTDTRLDVNSLEKNFTSDPISFGIYSKIQDLAVLSDFEVYEVKRDGTISSTRPAREYKQLLIDSKLRDRIKFGYLPAYYGTGLGDALTYRIKVNGKLEIKTEPFVMNGMTRVQIYGDENNENMEIQEYGILNAYGREIYRFKAKDVIHHKYSSPNASTYFSASPGLVASKWLNLKYNILSAVDANASGGFKGSFFMSLDTQKLQKMGFSANGLEEAKGKLKEELRQANGIQNAGRMVFTPFPVVMQNTQMSNSEQRSNEFVPLINNEIFYAYGVDPAILDKRNSKYDTADQARDDLYQSCQATFKTIEQDVERGDLKFIDPNFDNSRFIFRIPRQFSQEEIRIKEIKNRELQIFFGNLKTANETFSAQGLVALPTEDKLKSLEEQGIYIKTIAKEVINIKPSAEPQLADTFTQVSHGENVNRSKEKVKDYGCVMAMYEPTQFKVLTDKIDKNDLFINPDEPLQNGVVEEFHTTLLYGLHPEVQFKSVKKVMDSWSSEEAGEALYSILIGEKYSANFVGIFSNPEKEYDVLVLKMGGLVFGEANKALKQLPYTNNFPNYIPHTTLAYLKKGTAEKYKNLDIPQNLDFTIKDIVYSPANDKEYISLLTNPVRNKKDFWQETKDRLDKSFKAVLSN